MGKQVKTKRRTELDTGLPSGTDVATRLLGYLEKGELIPITRIKILKHLSPSTRCRLALMGTIPAIRVGSRLLTHPVVVEEALRASVIKPGASKFKSKPKSLLSHQSAARQAEIAAAKERNRQRGLGA